MNKQDLVIGREYVSSLGVTFKLIEMKDGDCLFSTEENTPYYCACNGIYPFSEEVVLKSFKPVKE